MPRKTAVITFLLFFTTIFASPALGQQEKYVGDHVAGAFEKISERFSLVMTFSSTKKSEKKAQLLNKRLGELGYVVSQDKLELFEEVSYRYAAYAGRLVDFVNEKKVDSRREEVKNLLIEHESILSQWQSKYEHDSAWWLLIQHDINAINELSEKL